MVLTHRSDQEHPRFGLTVSRKVGNAVVRNRVKRWLREVLRHRKHRVADVDVVIIARRNAGSAGLAELGRQIDRALVPLERS